MGILDGILGQVTGNMDVANLAKKVGLSPEQVESVVHALAKFHPAEGDTAENTAGATGVPVDKVHEIIGHIGGEGALTRFSQLLHGDGEGMLGKLGGLASGLFGKD